MVIPYCWRSDLPTCPSAFAVEPGGPHRSDSVPDPACDATIGMVVFRSHKGERAEAILDGDGTWCCPRLPVLDRVLNALYDPSRDTGSDMPFGHAELIRVAAWLRGEAKIRRP